MGKYFDETISKFVVCGETYVGLHKAQITIRRLRGKDGLRYEVVVYTDAGHTYYPGKLSETPQEAFKSIVVIDMLDEPDPKLGGSV